MAEQNAAQANATELAVAQQEQNNSMLVFGNVENFEAAQRMAKLLMASSIVPQQYQNNLANCTVALEMANRMGASPLLVMQNLYIVHGNPGWSSKFLIATLNACGKFSPLRYREFGEEGTDDWGCYAYAIDKMTGEELQGPKVTIGMAKKEGWFSKTGSKWQTMPQLMLHYRAAAFFQRTYAPEISMGLMTSEEIQDIDGMETPTRSRVRMTTEERIAQMNEAREALRRQQAEDVEVEDVNQPARSGELFQ
jgi:hypothetical protein